MKTAASVMVDTWARAWQLARTLDSATSEAECLELFCAANIAYAHAQEYRQRTGLAPCAVEIGTWQGRTAVVLGHAMPNIHVHTIDPFVPFVDAGTGKQTMTPSLEQVQSALSERQCSHVRIIARPSVEVAEDWHYPVGLLFIDGDHYNPMADWDAWRRHLVPGAIVAWHDYYPDDPASVFRAVAEGVDGLLAQGVLSLVDRAGSLVVTEYSG